MWQPQINWETIKKRAELLNLIRNFFAERAVIEVVTPLLLPNTVTDPYIESLLVAINPENKFYLQTSPEYAMKRLLAAYPQSIYQITKAFRKEEQGKWHHFEFTLLEWYRINFDHLQLMQEVDELLQLLLQTKSARYFTYQAIFQEFLKIDPLTISQKELLALAQQKNIATDKLERQDLLQILMSTCIEPYLGQEQPVFIYNYPYEQAALAKLLPDNPKLAARFELYFKGIELVNGFAELQDAAEQKKRFAMNNQKRISLGLGQIAIDELFLQALQHGLPTCAGCALGLDRLIMLAYDKQTIEEVLF